MFMWYCNGCLFWLHCSRFQELRGIQTHRDKGDLMRLPLFSQNKKSRLKTNQQMLFIFYCVIMFQGFCLSRNYAWIFLLICVTYLKWNLLFSLALVDEDTGEYILNGGFMVSIFRKLLLFGEATLEYTGSQTVVERVNSSSRPLKKDLILEVICKKIQCH